MAAFALALLDRMSHNGSISTSIDQVDQRVQESRRRRYLVVGYYRSILDGGGLLKCLSGNRLSLLKNSASEGLLGAHRL